MGKIKDESFYTKKTQSLERNTEDANIFIWRDTKTRKKPECLPVIERFSIALFTVNLEVRLKLNIEARQLQAQATKHCVFLELLKLF